MTTHVLKKKRASGRGLVLVYVILIALVLYTLFPLVVLLLNSVKSHLEVGVSPFALPRKLRLENYAVTWRAGNYARAFINSGTVASFTALGVVTFALMGAYSLGRLHVPGGDALMMYLFIANTIPSQLFLVPLFFAWNKLGLVNVPVALAIIYWARQLPFQIFLMRSFFVGMAPDFEDAGRIDGASELQILWRIIVPMARPAVLTGFLLSFMSAWNEFMFAVLFLYDRNAQTAAIRFLVFVAEQDRTADWNLISAAGVMVILPILLLFLLLQEAFIQGLTQGGIKA